MQTNDCGKNTPKISVAAFFCQCLGPTLVLKRRIVYDVAEVLQ